MERTNELKEQSLKTFHNKTNTTNSRAKEKDKNTYMKKLIITVTLLISG